ncbi:hypothetical protein GWK47_044791 [Chionoecetes opilio]|uniref:Uncharacterized protein n=1 Tax=Chionoecetes opilio TaxID=41210 RepID=A0A8J4YIW1_CHIOP|nr:hypothetical protein GWK47_044791 [Chionoecetes opilio]
MGMGEVHVQLLSGPSVTMSALVMRTRPLGFDFVMGMNGIHALRGVTVRSLDDVKFGIEESEVVTAAATALQRDVDEKDFGVTYDVKAARGLCHGSGAVARGHRDCRIQFQSIACLKRPGRNTRMNCVNGSRMVGWFRTVRLFTGSERKLFP